MGVIYKLRAEVQEYIIEQKKVNPTLGCRELSKIASEKFNTAISKSSVNSLLKDAGLSSPLGRKRKKKRGALEIRNAGLLFLRCADYILGGSELITKTMRSHTKEKSSQIQAIVDYLLYQPLFDNKSPFPLPPADDFLAILHPKISPDYLKMITDLCEENKDALTSLSYGLSTLPREISHLTIAAPQGKKYFLDSQRHTLWATPKIPAPLASYPDRCREEVLPFVKGNAPLVLFMAPGYDSPSQEFFDLISSFTKGTEGIAALQLNMLDNAEGESLPLEPLSPRAIVFALWPWQFLANRDTKVIGDYREFTPICLQKKFLIAPAEVTLTQSQSKTSLTLKGCALKDPGQEQPRLIVLTNRLDGHTRLETLADTYLNKWPNLEETFQDLSRKIKNATVAKDTPQRYFSSSLSKEGKGNLGLTGILTTYLAVLEDFMKWYFLPAETNTFGSPSAKKDFYALDGQVKKQNNAFAFSFLPPQTYPFKKEIEYACRRINEMNILMENKKLWLEVTPDKTAV
jgi:hypothetical protein